MQRVHHRADFAGAQRPHIMVVALAGVGLSTNFRSFKGLGFRPFVVGLGAAVVVGVVSFLAITLMGSFVTF